MDSETVHGTVRSGAGSVPEAGPLFWKSVDAGWKRQKHGDGLPVLLPGQTGSGLPDRELSTASGAAGDEDNEKMVKKRPPQSRGGQKSFMTYHWH